MTDSAEHVWHHYSDAPLVGRANERNETKERVRWKTLDLGLNEETEEIIVGMAKLGAVFGTFLGGALMQQCGRKKAIAWNSVFFIAGPVVMAAANDAARGSSIPIFHLPSHLTRPHVLQ